MDPDLRHRLENLIARLPTISNPDRPDPALDDAQLLNRLRDLSRTADARLADLRHLASRHRVDRGATEAFQILLNDPDSTVVLGAIAEVPPFDLAALDRLHALVDDSRPNVRHAAAVALARRKDRGLIPRLARWLRGDDAGNRRTAIDALAWLAAPHDGDRLLTAAWDLPNLAVDERLILAHHLALRGDDRVADWLVELLDSTGPHAKTARQTLEILLNHATDPTETDSEQAPS